MNHHLVRIFVKIKPALFQPLKVRRALDIHVTLKCRRCILKPRGKLVIKYTHQHPGGSECEVMELRDNPAGWELSTTSPSNPFIYWPAKKKKKKRYFQRYDKRKIQEKPLIVPLNLNNMIYFNSKMLIS